MTPRIDSTINKLREAIPLAAAYAEAALNDVDFGNRTFNAWWDVARKDIPDDAVGFVHAIARAAWDAADRERNVSFSRTLVHVRRRIPAMLAVKIAEAHGCLTVSETADQFDVSERDVRLVWDGSLWPTATGVNERKAAS